MKTANFLNTDITESEIENFQKHLVQDNIHRGKILARIIILFDFLLAIADIMTSAMKVDDRFHFNGYLFMYSIMIATNLIYLLLIRQFERQRNISAGQVKHMETIIVVYITFVMSWGSIVSLMDQKLYGQLVVFMIMMITTSVLYYHDERKIRIPYLCSILILIIGLPIVQSSRDILIGHYINLSTFVIISWIASKLIYHSYVNDYNNKVLLQSSNHLLEKEIEENKVINHQLAAANLQLKKLALFDELTGIANRRGFRNYIDIEFDNNNRADSNLSILMIDIDFFKQFNDNYGHDEGDQVLIAVAKQINAIRTGEHEFFCRWGGEEFIYSIFNLGEEKTRQLAEAIRIKVCNLKIPNGYSGVNDYITVSIGTCTATLTGKEEIGKVINLADKALYLAKNSGRNCIKNIYEENI